MIMTNNGSSAFENRIYRINKQNGVHKALHIDKKTPGLSSGVRTEAGSFGFLLLSNT